MDRLHARKTGELWQHVDKRHYRDRMRCHDCHAPLERAEAKCPACGWTNTLDCPLCERPMPTEAQEGLRLDLCRTCKGVWFAHHEVETIWSAAFDEALRRRKLSLPRSGSLDAARQGAGDVLFDTLFYAPDLVYYGAHAAGHAVSASAQAALRLPAAIGAAPEPASAVFQAAGEAAGGVFEVILSVTGGIFDGL